MNRRFIPVCFFAGFCVFSFQSCCVLSYDKIYTIDSAKTVHLSEKNDGGRLSLKTKKLPQNIKSINTDGGYFNTTFMRFGNKNSVRIMQNGDTQAEIFAETYHSRPLAIGFILPLIPVKWLAKDSPLRRVSAGTACRIKISALKEKPVELLSAEFGENEKVFVARNSFPVFTKQDIPVNTADIHCTISEDTYIWIESPLTKTFSLKLRIAGSEYTLLFKQASVFCVWVLTV